MSRGRYFKEPCIIHDSAGIVVVIPCIYENMECYATLSDELDFAIYKDTDKKGEDVFFAEDMLLFGMFGESYNSKNKLVRRLATELMAMLESAKEKSIWKK